MAAAIDVREAVTAAAASATSCVIALPSASSGGATTPRVVVAPAVPLVLLAAPAAPMTFAAAFATLTPLSRTRRLTTHAQESAKNARARKMRSRSRTSARSSALNSDLDDDNRLLSDVYSPEVICIVCVCVTVPKERTCQLYGAGELRYCMHAPRDSVLMADCASCSCMSCIVLRRPSVTREVVLMSASSSVVVVVGFDAAGERQGGETAPLLRGGWLAGGPALPEGGSTSFSPGTTS